MAGQAGWYRAPGEAGQLRYWNGTAWTNHRQPDPAAVVPSAPEPTVDESDPMAHFEKQFTVSSLFDDDLDHPGADNVPSAPQPQYRPRSAATPALPISTPAPELVSNAASATSSLGPIALGPATSITPRTDAELSEFDRFFDEVTALVAEPKAEPTVEVPTALAPSTSTELVSAPAVVEPSEAAAAPAQAAPIGIAPTRKAVMGAVRIMAAAIILILLGVSAMAAFSATGTLGGGQAKTNAIVTSLGATTNNSCTPVATFAVKGRSYTANSSSAITPCPIGLGQSVDVIYSAANPASAAQIEVGGSAIQYLWVVPIIGGLIFVGGLIAFIVRAGSIVSGIRLLREKEKPSEDVLEPVEAS
ncbi:MAG TPA: DUF2510 domain-containing protein [Galbitalea sp.]|jgi:hypothetical protein